MEPRRMAALILLVMLVRAGVCQESTSQLSSQQTIRTKLILLGTGTPVPDPDRSGPATVIVVDDQLTLSISVPALCGVLSPLLLRERFLQLNLPI